MLNASMRKAIEEDHEKNLEDLIRHARWEAEMVKKLGVKWFKERDKWLNKSFEQDEKTWEKTRK